MGNCLSYLCARSAIPGAGGRGDVGEFGIRRLVGRGRWVGSRGLRASIGVWGCERNLRA